MQWGKNAIYMIRGRIVSKTHEDSTKYCCSVVHQKVLLNSSAKAAGWLLPAACRITASAMDQIGGEWTTAGVESCGKNDNLVSSVAYIFIIVNKQVAKTALGNKKGVCWINFNFN